MEKVKLFCFPYAGGSANVYSPWKDFVGQEIELIPIELSGRGSRSVEPLYNTTEEMIDDLFSIVMAQIDQHTRYALFGHSMGAKIAYEIGRRTVLHGMTKQPMHLFFSGKGAPDTRGDDKQFHLMSATEFKKELVGLGGTPREFFENKELMDFFLPVLKNDFKMAETAKWESNDFRFASDITVFMGKKDDMSPEQSDGWRNQTEGQCKIYFFDGDHFFIHDHYKEMLKIICRELTKKQAVLTSY